MSVAVFPGVKDPSTRADLVRWAASVESRLPWAEGQFVDVTFNAPNIDHDIAHTLRTDDPSAIRWIIVSTTAAASVYKDGGVSPLPWQSTHIWLRASAAATMRLFLFTEAT